jgi:hypothetical protein
MLQVIPPLVTNEDNRALLKRIEEEEILKAIWGLKLDKAPSLESFTVHF